MKGMWGKGWGKGWGKCKCKGKGPGKGKGKVSSWDETTFCHSAENGLPEKCEPERPNGFPISSEDCRPCAMDCGFQATWHPTWCCVGCASGKGHGPRCEKKHVAPVREDNLSMESEPPSSEHRNISAEPQSASPELHSDSAARLVFPVVLGDGRQLSIEWGREEDPQHVSHRFAKAHGIEDDELPTIVAFIEQANAMTRPVVAQTVAEEVCTVGNNEELGLEEKVSQMGLRDEDTRA